MEIVTSKSKFTDDQLVQQIQSGNSGLFSELFERHYLRVFRFAASMTFSVENAKDIAQETFLRVFRSIQT